MGLENPVWTCPMSSCRNSVIYLNRNNEVIDTPSYQKVIVHFLQHLKIDNGLFGAIDIQNIFLEHTPEDILLEEDREQYPNHEIIWKNRIRSALSYLTSKELLETIDKSEMTDFFNTADRNKQSYRTRRRTDKFFHSHLIYNDWELYSLKIINSINTNDFSIEFVVPKPSETNPFIDFENNQIKSGSHGQIQKKNFYEFFKSQTQSDQINFEINLKFISFRMAKIFKDRVKVTAKGTSAYATLMITYLKKLIDNQYVLPDDLKSGSILKFSKISDNDSFLMEIITESKLEVELEDRVMTSLKELFKYSNKIVEFFTLKEENKNQLIAEIYEENDESTFKTMLDEFDLDEGPVKTLRYLILDLFIKDKKNNEENTNVTIESIESLIQTLCTEGHNGTVFEENSFDIWKPHFYVRVLLYFYDFKRNVRTKRQFLTIIKFLLKKLNLEDEGSYIDLFIDDDGTIAENSGRKKQLRNIKIENTRFSILDFTGPTYRFSYSSWIAIYPSQFVNHKQAYQIFLNINDKKKNEILLGVYPGTEVVTNKCIENKKVESIPFDSNDPYLIEKILEIYEKLLGDYFRLNELESKYSNYEKIVSWFGSPQPPNDQDYENTIFSKMMEENFYAIGWNNFQYDLTNLTSKEIEQKYKRIEEGVSSQRINYHISLKESMKIGDIIIAKKGDDPSAPVKRVYGIGLITSHYNFDAKFDMSNNFCNHYRELNWYVNFFKDYKNGILEEPFLDLKDILDIPLTFEISTLNQKDFVFYLKIKNAILQKIESLTKRKLINETQQKKYLKQFADLEAFSRCVQANLFDDKTIVPSLPKKKSPKINFDVDRINIEKLHFQNSEGIIKKIIKALKNGKNLILIGPPGTGKSKLAKQVCKYYCDDEFIMSTATSEWSTFETIGGYIPNPDKDGKLEFFPGLFLQCFKDNLNYDINKWLIIDEINRADIDKAFGSLFSALTGDNISLAYRINGKPIQIIGDNSSSQKPGENLYLIPEDWRIIATMNTFDKASLYEMSYAFMRRFAFIPIDAPFKIDNNLMIKYTDIWGINLNKQQLRYITEIWNMINEYRTIGPAIIEDICQYIKDGNDYVSALILFVLPQFEGLPDDKVIDFCKEIKNKNIIQDIDEISRFCKEFFDIEPQKFK